MHVVRWLSQCLNSIQQLFQSAGENPSAFLRQTLVIYLPFLNAVAFSGRFYGDTRMDTNWALRQAYIWSIRIIMQSLTIFSTDTTRRARLKKNRMRTVMLLLLGSGLVWVNSPKTCSGKH